MTIVVDKIQPIISHKKWQKKSSVMSRNITFLSAITDEIMVQTGCIFHPSIVSVHCTRILLYAIPMIMFLTANLNINFLKLEEEECEICELHISHLKEEHMLTEIRAHKINRWEKN